MFNFLKKKTEEEKELLKNSSKISKGLSTIFNSKKIDETSLEELEELLISADINIYIVEDIINFIRNNRFNKETTIDDIKNIIYNKLMFIFKGVGDSDILNIDEKTKKPYVLLFLGVNGSGKTTFIGKLANRLADDGKKVLLAGCDTFRVGASEQLKVWADKARVDIVLKERDQQDPASVIYTAYNKAKDEGYDVLLVDTAGRLQNNTNLMNELSKMVNVVKKLDPDAFYKNLLVLDATIGQNSNNQAMMFSEAIEVDGIIMNKFDGTAKGGSLISIVNETKKPVVAIGNGEKIGDLENFDADKYLKNLLGIDYEK